MKSHWFVLGAASVAALVTVPSWAHHAFSAVFDDSKTVTVSGVLTKVDWVNPHVYFYVESKSDSGAAPQEWSFESHPPAALRKAGLPREMLIVGDTVKVEGFVARDGSKNLAFAKTVQFADGRVVRIMLDPKQNQQNP